MFGHIMLKKNFLKFYNVNEVKNTLCEFFEKIDRVYRKLFYSSVTSHFRDNAAVFCASYCVRDFFPWLELVIVSFFLKKNPEAEVHPAWKLLGLDVSNLISTSVEAIKYLKTGMIGAKYI